MTSPGPKYDAAKNYQRMAETIRAQRRILEAAGLAEQEPDPPPAFVCPECGARSWHPEDGRQGYCGRCHAFTGRLLGPA